jgi:hypothetical protein
MTTQNLSLAASQQPEKESDALAQQLRDLERRRDEWATQTEQAEARLTDARAKALAGKGSAAEITTAQSEHSALAGLLSEADTQLSELSAMLQHAQADEKRAAIKQRIRDLNEQKKDNAAAYDERLKGIDEYLRTHIPSLAAERQRDGELGCEIAVLGGVSDVQPLGRRRWSDSGLRYSVQIAQMLDQEWREEERREDEQRRTKIREREKERNAVSAPLKVA